MSVSYVLFGRHRKFVKYSIFRGFPGASAGKESALQEDSLPSEPPRIAATNDHKLGGLKCQNLILSLFWRPEI